MARSNRNREVAQEQRVAIYARFSSDKQSDASIEDQVRRARDKTTALGRDPQAAMVFTDYAVSGASMKRPGVQALIEAIASGQVDLVVTESVDRISRNAKEALGFRETLKQHKVALECLDGTRLVGNDKNALLMFGIRGLLGEQYLIDLADKTLRGLEGRALAGAPTGGVAYGYRTVAKGEAKTIEVVPSQAKIVRRIFRLYADGASFAVIASQLNELGIDPPRAHNRRNGKGWMASAVREMLLNDRYRGVWTFGEREWVKSPTTGKRVSRKRDGGPLVTQERPELAIVEQELWAQVASRFEGRERSPQAPRRYMLTGLLHCANCGAKMTCIGGKNRRYGCSASFKRGTSVCDNRVTSPVGEMEATIMNALKARLGKRMNEVRAIVQEEIAKALANRPDRRRELENEIRGLTNKAENLLEALAHTPSKAIGAKLREVELQRDKLTQELGSLQDDGVSKLPPVATITEGVASIVGLSEADPLTARERFRTVLSEERIDCMPTASRNYRLSWAVRPGEILRMIGYAPSVVGPRNQRMPNASGNTAGGV